MALNSTPSRPLVCILTSGKGTRMGPSLSVINKALLPLDNAALLTHIIRRFPADTRFVIALGHQNQQVQDYVALAHPELSVTWVPVPVYEGPGSGPGLSLLACEPELKSPFFFVACDTLWTQPIPLDSPDNWAAAVQVDDSRTSQYCNFELRGAQVVRIHDKKAVQGDSYRSFTGLCYIRDTAIFWEGLRRKSLVQGEHQISDGLRALIDQKALRVQSIDWVDVGDLEHYKAAILQRQDFDFSKTNEFLYTVNRRVIKFFADATITRRRVERARMNPSVFPGGIEERGSFYSYGFVDGQTMYEFNSPALFRKLLDWLDQNLWKSVTVDQDAYRRACQTFYETKTRERVALYQKKYAVTDAPARINGRQVPSLQDALSRIPWNTIAEGIPVFFHGDLQFDNILSRQGGDFALLDWRQDFAGQVAFGDLRYDLAKLYGGIILNYDYIKKNLLSYTENGNEMEFDFAQRHRAPEYRAILEAFAQKKGLPRETLRQMTALIYLNMSPLHEPPFDKMLYSLGRWMLADQ